jgi:phage terminase large subunit GpA-like protein
VRRTRKQIPSSSSQPQWRGLLELYEDPRVHYFTLAKSARIGGTLFFGICLVIESILRDPGPIGWLDPTRRSAQSLSRREIEPYLSACPSVMALAIVSKTTWTTLEKIFLNGIFTRPPHSPTPLPVPTVPGAADAKANS